MQELVSQIVEEFISENPDKVFNSYDISQLKSWIFYSLEEYADLYVSTYKCPVCNNEMNKSKGSTIECECWCLIDRNNPLT